jgi:hypothetical protein
MDTAMKTEPLRKMIKQWRDNATAAYRNELQYGQKYSLLCEKYYSLDRETRCVGCPIAAVHGPECGPLWDLSNEAEWAIDDWWGDFDDPHYDYRARVASTALANALEETLKTYEQQDVDNV